MLARINKVKERLHSKIAASSSTPDDLFQKWSSDELAWLWKAKNIETQTRCLTAFSFITLGSLTSLLYFTLHSRRTSRFDKSIILHPLNLLLIGGSVATFKIYQAIQAREIHHLYNIYNPIDDPEDAALEWKRMQTTAKERAASRASLSKYKYDPQSYH